MRLTRQYRPRRLKLRRPRKKIYKPPRNGGRFNRRKSYFKKYKSRYNNRGKTYSNYYSKRKWSKWNWRRVKPLDQDRKATWLMAENLKSTIGTQAVSWWLGGYGGSIPTVDPGTGGISDLRKIWWEETGSAVGNRTRGIFLERFNFEYNIVNNAEAACHVVIYNIIARRDVDIDPFSLWSAGMADTNLKFIEAGASITPACTVIGTTPFHSSTFCQYFKVTRSQRTILLGGQSYMHKATFNIKKRIDGEFFRNIDQTRKGLSCGILVVLQGQIINDLNSAAEVQYALASINTTMKKTIEYKLDQSENRDVVMYFNNLSNKTGVTAPLFVQPESGAIDTTMTTT